MRTQYILFSRCDSVLPFFGVRGVRTEVDDVVDLDIQATTRISLVSCKNNHIRDCLI